MWPSCPATHGTAARACWGRHATSTTLHRPWSLYATGTGPLRRPQALDRHEPQNAELYFRAARPFARLAARRADVLQLTQTLVDRACKLAPGKAEYAA